MKNQMILIGTTILFFGGVFVAGRWDYEEEARHDRHETAVIQTVITTESGEVYVVEESTGEVTIDVTTNRVVEW